MDMRSAQVSVYPLLQESIGPAIREAVRVFRPAVYDAARFYGVSELKGLLRLIAGEKARVVWRATLFPRCWPWPQARLPWGALSGWH